MEGRLSQPTPNAEVATSMRRALRAMLFLALGLSAVVCSEPTGPSAAPTATVRLGWSIGGVLAGLTPEELTQAVPYDRVRLSVRTGTAELVADTTVAAATSLTAVDVRVPLRPAAGSNAETLTFSLRFVSLASGDTVLRGDLQLLVRAQAPGASPQLASVGVTYAGSAAQVARVEVLPGERSVLASDSLVLSAVAFGASDEPLPNAVLLYRSLDVTRLRIATVSGRGQAQPARGEVAVEVRALNGVADTTWYTVRPRPERLVLGTASSLRALPSAPVSEPVVVQLLATDGAPLEGRLVNVSTPDGGSVSPSTAATDTLGRVAFSWTLGPAVGPQRLRIASADVDTLVVDGAALADGALRAVVLDGLPNVVSAGVGSGAPLVVEVQDSSGTPQLWYMDSLRLAVVGGGAGGRLLGQRAAPVRNGRAEFRGWSIDRAGEGYRLSLTGTAVAPETTAVLSVRASDAGQFAIQSGSPQTAAPGAVLPAPIVVLVTDVAGNPVANRVVSFVPLQGTASVSLDTTDAGGTASTSWTLGPEAGPQRLDVTVPGVGGAVSAWANDTAGPIVSIDITAPDTLHALEATAQLSASAQDGAGRAARTTLSWSSADPAVISVTSAGVVRAEATGSSWIRVVAHDGTTDSTLLHVVQRVARVAISGQPSRLHAGGRATLSTRLADANGHLIVRDAPVLWRVSDTTVATIDGAGAVTARRAGRTQVVASVEGTPGTVLLTVESAATSITLHVDGVLAGSAAPQLRPQVGDAVQVTLAALDTAVTPFPDSAYAWKSDLSEVGVVDSVRGGNLWLRVTGTGAGQLVGSVGGESRVVVLEVPRQSAAMSLRASASVLAPGGAARVVGRVLDGAGRDLGLPVEYRSSNEAVLTVAENGSVRAEAIGTANLVAVWDTLESAAVTLTVQEAAAAKVSFAVDTLLVPFGSSLDVPVTLSRALPDPLLLRTQIPDSLSGPFSTWEPALEVGQTSTEISVSTAVLGDVVLVLGTSSPDVEGDTLVVRTVRSVEWQRLDGVLPMHQPLDLRFSVVPPVGPEGLRIAVSSEEPTRLAVEDAVVELEEGAASFTVRATSLAEGAAPLRVTGSGIASWSDVIYGLPSPLELRTVSSTAVPGAAAGPLVVVRGDRTGRLEVTLTSSDPSVLRPQATVVLEEGEYATQASAAAIGVGTAEITAAAPGRGQASATLAVAQPRWTFPTGAVVPYTHLGQTVLASATLRLGSEPAWIRGRDYVVRFSLSDPSFGVLTDTLVRLSPGDSTPTVLVTVAPTGDVEQTYLRASGDEIPGDSLLIRRLQSGVQLEENALTLGLGQSAPVVVRANGHLESPLTVRFTSRAANRVSVTDSTVIPAGANPQRTFWLRGERAGFSYVVATADGTSADSMFVTAYPGNRLELVGGGVINRFAPFPAPRIYVRDSLDNRRRPATALRVALVSSDTSVLAVPDSVTVPADSAWLALTALDVRGPGRARIAVSAENYRSDSVEYDVLQRSVSFIGSLMQMARSRLSPVGQSVVTVEYPATERLPVQFSLLGGENVSLVQADTAIEIGNSSAQFRLLGLQLGTDTLVVAVPGFSPDTIVVEVIGSQLVVSDILGDHVEGSLPTVARVRATAANTVESALQDTLRVAITSSDTTVLRVRTPVVTIVPGESSAEIGWEYPGAGEAVVTATELSALGHAPGASSVLNIAAAPDAPQVQSTRETYPPRADLGGWMQVIVPTVDTLSDRTLRLSSDDPSIIEVPDSVVIPRGSTVVGVPALSGAGTGSTRIRASVDGSVAEGVGPELRLRREPMNVVWGYSAVSVNLLYRPRESFSLSLRSENPDIVAVDTVVTFPAGVAQAIFPVLRRGQPGVFSVVARDLRANSEAWLPLRSTLENAPRELSLNGVNVGLGQYEWVYPTVDPLPDSATTFAVRHRGLVSLPPIFRRSVPDAEPRLQATGLQVGVDTLVVSGGGYPSSTASITVTQGTLLDLLGIPLALAVGDSVLVRIGTANGFGAERPVAQPTAFTIVAPPGLAVVSGGALSVPLTSITVPADSSTAEFWIKGTAPASAVLELRHPWYETKLQAMLIFDPTPPAFRRREAQP